MALRAIDQVQNVLVASLLLVLAVSATSGRVAPIKATDQHGETYHMLVDHPETLRRVRRTVGRQPIRIRPFYDTTVEDSLSTEKRGLVKRLVTDAIKYFKETFSVDPLSAPIRLMQTCENHTYWPDVSNLTVRYCLACAPVSKCGVVTVPREHLASCHTCIRDGGTRTCTGDGNEGAGVSNADLALYVSSNSTADCGASANVDKVAFAALCLQEGAFDRPIAGYINICPGALSTSASLYPNQLGTVKHELYHILGFSPKLFAYYRDANGAPRTPRNDSGQPRLGNITVTQFPDVVYHDEVYRWSDETVATVSRSWQTSEGEKSRTDYFMVTPKVQEFVRTHFNCSTLLGAQLENQGGVSTALTHWEKVVFENEGMCGVYTQHAVFSGLTLALMEDTGWYDINYSKAEVLLWGRDLGCEFANKSCLSWMETKLTRSEAVEPFCLNLKTEKRRFFCNLDRDAVAICNLGKFDEAVPADYRYMTETTLPTISSTSRDHYGGRVIAADYCPYYQQFKVTSNNGVEMRRSVCTFSANAPMENTGLELYGEHSKCVENGQPWSYGGLPVEKQYGAGCYKFYCQLPNSLKIDVGLARVDCTGHEGITVCISQTIGGELSTGSIICPSFDDMCEVNGNFAAPPPLYKIPCPDHIPCTGTGIAANINVTFVRPGTVCTGDGGGGGSGAAPVLSSLPLTFTISLFVFLFSL